MTRAQQRAVALSAVRYQLRKLYVNLLEVSADDAHAALDDYARWYPAIKFYVDEVLVFVSSTYRTPSTQTSLGSGRPERPIVPSGRRYW